MAKSFSNSKLMKLRKCQRSCWWNYEAPVKWPDGTETRGLVRKEKPVYFTVGEIFHEGHKKWYHPTSLFMDLSGRIDATKQHIEDYGKDIGAPDDMLLLVQKMTNALVRESTHDKFTPISVEQWMEVPFPGFKDVTYIVKADGLVMMTDTGKLKGLEAKTTSGIGANYLNNLRNGPQCRGTVWTLSQVVKKPIDGMVFNVCNKAKAPRCVQEIVTVNSKHIEMWLSSTTQWIELYLSKDPDDPLQWLRNDDACYDVRYGECDYVILEKFGPTPEVLKLFEPYRQHRPDLTTDGGI